jgi:hypothetical protein
MPTEAEPFLVITPLGLHSDHEILWHSFGVRPLKTFDLFNWNENANCLRRRGSENQTRAFSQAWKCNFPLNQAKIWVLSPEH